MRAPDNFTFVSLVLLTLCTTKPMPPAASSTEATAAVRAAVHRGVVHTPDRIASPRVVGRHPS